ncbi:MAG TPA: hypothetical protein PK188_04445 [Thermosynergistes sp.]|nr:hypothetical protein [Thermosynergistes sp.]
MQDNKNEVQQAREEAQNHVRINKFKNALLDEWNSEGFWRENIPFVEEALFDPWDSFLYLFEYVVRDTVKNGPRHWSGTSALTCAFMGSALHKLEKRLREEANRMVEEDNAEAIAIQKNDIIAARLRGMAHGSKLLEERISAIESIITDISDELEAAFTALLEAATETARQLTSGQVDAETIYVDLMRIAKEWERLYEQAGDNWSQAYRKGLQAFEEWGKVWVSLTFPPQKNNQ